MFTDEYTPAYAVLGATGRIGSELCRRLVCEGARLLIGARQEEKLKMLAGELKAPYVALDATQTEQVEQFVARGFEVFGKVDGIANCVGSLMLKPAHDTTDDEWALTIGSNLTSGFATVRAAGKLMREKGGSVVLMSSAAGRIGIPNHEAIAAAKAGIIGLVLSASATYARHGIRFNCVAPGLVQTPLSAPVISSESARRVSVSMHALGRLGSPSDVASAISWLLHPSQSWVTGQILGVDGGLATVRTWS